MTTPNPFAQKVSKDPLGLLRDLLYRRDAPEGRDTDRKVCHVLGRLQEREEAVFHIAHDYVHGHWQDAPWMRHRFTGGDKPVGWQLWDRLRMQMEAVPKKPCKICKGSGEVIDKLGGFMAQVRGCKDCKGTGVEIPPMLVWRTPLTTRSALQARGPDWEAMLTEEDGFADLPQVDISWYSALRSCNRLSEAFGFIEVYVDPDEDAEESEPVRLEDANGFRLPTVARWEHFAGEVPSTSIRCEADDCDEGWDTRRDRPCGWCDHKGRLESSELDRCAWHAGNSDGRVHPVGQKAPNFAGLYDCWGNVWEWCWGTFEGSYPGLNYHHVCGGSVRLSARQIATMDPHRRGERADWDIGLRPVLPLETIQ